jgi:hypothetical protein
MDPDFDIIVVKERMVEVQMPNDNLLYIIDPVASGFDGSAKLMLWLVFDTSKMSENNRAPYFRIICSLCFSDWSCCLEPQKPRRTLASPLLGCGTWCLQGRHWTQRWGRRLVRVGSELLP